MPRKKRNLKPKLKHKRKRKYNLFKWFVIVSVFSFISLGVYLKGIFDGRKTAVRFYTDLPNSCFVESMIHASRASLLLATETGVFSSVYGFTYRYADDYRINKSKGKLFGHAVCIFEYKGTLWLYDAVWGTMPVGKATNRVNYDKMLRKFIEENYEYKLEKSFVVDDWGLSPR